MIIRWIKSLASLSLLVVMLATALSAQTPTAQLSGRITDHTGGVVVGARITVTNVDTQIERETVSNQEGYWTAPLLEPGAYRIAVQMPGFRTISRSGVTLHVNQSARLDFVLELGELSDAVSVTGDALQLQTGEGSLGTVVDNTKIVNLPLNGRNPFDLVFLTPGTQSYARPSLPGNSIPLSNFSTNGGPAATNEFLMDGIPNESIAQSQFVVVPSIDATQEFKVQTNSLSAEFGRTGGGVINLTLKSGSNNFRGVLFEFLRNDKLDANNWFANRAGKSRPPFRFNQFGGSLGGPIVKNNSFFFVNYEGLRRTEGRTTLITVPTLEMRRGDFSRLQSAAGQPVQIFNPLTTRMTATGRIRDPFPENRIPLNLMDPVALKMLEFWPLPNLPGDARTGANNFISTEAERFSTNQVHLRIDQKLTRSHQLFGRFSWDGKRVTPPNIFGNIANPSSGPQLFATVSLGLHDTWTINATTLATFRVGFNRLRDDGEPYGKGFDIRQLGFPAGYAAAQSAIQFPQITVTGMTVSNLGFGTSGLGPVNSSELRNFQNAYTTQSDVTLVRGKHVFKFGADARVFRVHGTRPSNGGGSFNFTPGFTQGPDPTRAGPTSGQAFASFLLGAAASGSIALNPTQDLQSYYLGFFAQDDFKVTPKLTLNLGLRWEPESGRTDRYDRLTFLDLTSPSPVQASSLGRQIASGPAFVGQDGNPRSQTQTSWNNWGPRFGFAYHMLAKLVARGGYGIFYVPRSWRGIGFGQLGFSSTTPYVGSADGFTPNRFLRDPFPNGFIQPTGSDLGLATNLGQALNSPDYGQLSPYVQQWNLGIQNSLPGDVLLEVAYAGSKGTRLIGDLNFNQIPDQFLALGNDLLLQVPNPFFGQIPAGTTLGARTIAAGQLLRPYPQFTSVTDLRATGGSSIYHSMQLRVDRRFSQGLSLLLSYTVAKLIDDGSPGNLAFLGGVPNHQNHNNRRLERSISSQEVPQRLVISYVYEFPVGRGKRFLKDGGALSRILGGWQMSGISAFQSGQPLALTTASNPTLGAVGAGALRPDSNGKSARLSGPTVDRLDRYFDTSVFSQPAPWKFGNTSRTLPNLRAPGVVNFDFSLVKNTLIRERHKIQLRGEFFNLFNNTNFGAPGEVFGNPNFGVISSARDARIIQVALKWYF